MKGLEIRNMEELKIVRLNIQLTKKCNQKCKSCNWYLTNCSDELSVKEIKSVIKQVTQIFPIKNIALTGGEPTLHKNIIEIAQYARRFCEKVSVTTNGYYCTSSEKILELVKAGINRFSFSYHGIGDHDDFVGTSGSEERIRNAIAFLSKIKEENELYVKIGTLFTGDNITKVEKMLDFAESNNVDLYIELLDTMIPIFAHSEIAKQNRENKEEEIILAVKKIREWIDSGRRVLCDYNGLNFINAWFNNLELIGNCPLWSTDLYVDSKGGVYPGCWFFSPIGNIRKNTIEEIYMGNDLIRTIDNMKNRNCGRGCTCGYLMQSKYIDFKRIDLDL